MTDVRQLLVGQVQAVPDGAAGWVASSLFGSLLAWLCLRHLPAKDQQIRELIERQDAQNAQMMAKFERCLEAISAHVRERDRERRDDFNAALASIREMIEAQRRGPRADDPAEAPHR